MPLVRIQETAEFRITFIPGSPPPAPLLDLIPSWASAEIQAGPSTVEVVNRLTIVNPNAVGGEVVVKALWTREHVVSQFPHSPLSIDPLGATAVDIYFKVDPTQGDPDNPCIVTAAGTADLGGPIASS